MRFQVKIKAPDAVQASIDVRMRRAARALDDEDLSHDDVDARLDEMAHEMQAEAERWFQHGEYLTVELDTEAHTATVVKP